MKNNIIMTVVVAVIVGAAAFFGGMKYQQSQTSASQQQSGGRNGGQGGRNRNGGGGGRVVGDIITADDKSITVKLPDGSTKLVLLSDSTSINQATTASKSALAVGTRVGVFGTDNTDGSVTAQNVQINPMMRMGGQGGDQSPTPSAQNGQ